MSGIVAFLSAKGVALASGAGLALLLGLAIKLVPKLLSNLLGKNLDKLLSTQDPADKELLLALVKWAEKKIPEPGQGKARFDLVAAKLVAWFPVLKKSEAKISELIEAAVTAMDNELKKRE